MNYLHLDSPIGMLQLVSDGRHLLALEFQGQHSNGTVNDDPNDPILTTAAAQLRQYFNGQRRHFDLPLGPSGTPFQQSVWAALGAIPYGELRSYRDIAETIGKPTAVRAVGAANGRNPLPIVIPCHRVIGSNGALTGFAGGLSVKEELLTLEGALPRPVDRGANP